ncbi:hypothetical protein V6N11_019594 [Hibiscus sabdariffa]|uniref:Uncharacterized protein n=1 Tax=Hibiscus sabdariffa TaxID=183260 RepID=A0ABR2NLQ4_9ROSI
MEGLRYSLRLERIFVVEERRKFIANQLDPPSGNDLVYPGGKPPDIIPSIPKITNHERSEFDPGLDDGRSVKKGRIEEPPVNGISDNLMNAGNEETQVRTPCPDVDAVIVDVGG